MNRCSISTAEAGTIAVPMAVMLLSFIMIAGFATDFARLHGVRSSAQAAADLASLNGAQLGGASDEELTTQLAHILDANFADKQALADFTFSANRLEGGNIAVTVQGRMPTTFMGVVGVEDMAFNVSSEATSGTAGLELVLAFDSTASMGFGDSWELATGTLENVLISIYPYTGNETLYVTLIPFQDRVPIGTNREGWLEDLAPTDWEGCVEPREEEDGSFEWALDDDLPTSEPFQASIPNVVGGLVNHGNGFPFCPDTPITGPTNNIADVISATNTLSQGGTGRFDVGMVWAWRALSPKWQGRWGPAGYPATDTSERRKVVLYVTDGLTNAYRHEAMQDTTTAHNRPPALAFEHLVHICDQMKEDDIEIFMVQIKGNNEAPPFFKACASSPEFYYRVNNNTELLSTFAMFGDQLRPRVRLVN